MNGNVQTFNPAQEEDTIDLMELAGVLLRKAWALALAFVKTLEGEHTELIDTLQRQVDRIVKRRKEEKAHQKNVRRGKKTKKS